MSYKIVILTLLFFQVMSTCHALDTSKDGPVYGDPEGLARVDKLEQQLHNMQIRQDHPRIFINQDTVEIYRNRVRRYNEAFEAVKEMAEKGDIVNLAFVYLMIEKDKPEIAGKVAKSVIRKLLEGDPALSHEGKIGQEIAKMALAFDWTYSAMNEEERKIVIDKLSMLAKIDERTAKIKNGYKSTGETFHREEWIFNSYVAWPEIALAYHVPGAELCYRSRWNYDWYWGDAARMYAYAADGTPFEGYYFGADGVDWFLALKSATGINLIDGELGWCKNAAYYTLYRLDLERGREIFHHGVSQGAGGCVSYREGASFWKIKRFLGRTLGLATDNPYIKWLTGEEIKLSSWALTAVNGHQDMPGLDGITKILFNDPATKSMDIKGASYRDLPYASLFSGGNEAYMRTGWSDKPACIGFRCSPAYTKNSHGDFDVNTFLIYKDGVLSPDSGVYDVYSGQGNYFCYQKNTIAHNDILVIDSLT